MRFQFLALICLFTLVALAAEKKGPILVSHNDIKGLDQSDSRTEELKIYADGRVSYQESGNYKKNIAFESKLPAQKLQRLNVLLGGKAMRAVPARIGPQIKVLGGQWDKKLEIDLAGMQQSIVIENFYPQLNGHRPAYPKALVELECMLQEIQRRAARRPPPSEELDWCPDALGKR